MIFRASFEERNTKVAIVLIQKNDPLLTGTVEDSLITERSAEALCASCEINRNCLLLLHLNDHLQGYVLRYGSLIILIVNVTRYTIEFNNICDVN